MSIFKESPKSSLAYKIYSKANLYDPCIAEAKGSKFLDMVYRKQLDNLFMLMVETSFAPKIVQLYARRDTYSNPKPVFEGPRALALSKKLKKLHRDYFNLVLDIYREFGLFAKGLRLVKIRQFFVGCP